MTVLQYDAEDLNHAAAMAGSNNNNGEGGTAMGSGHAATAAVAVGGLNRGRTVAGSPGKPRNMRTFYITIMFSLENSPPLRRCPLRRLGAVRGGGDGLGEAAPQEPLESSTKVGSPQ